MKKVNISSQKNKFIQSTGKAGMKERRKQLKTAEEKAKRATNVGTCQKGSVGRGNKKKRIQNHTHMISGHRSQQQGQEGRERKDRKEKKQCQGNR